MPHKNNLRVLLCTLQDVMWQGATWKRVGMADVMDPSVVKKLYYKAVMLVHPDKQANAGPDQEYIANRVFGALNEAWKEHKVSN